MVFGSRGLQIGEKDSRSYIEGLTEHAIASYNDIASHVHHAFQVRKSIIKPDSKLKFKSHFVALYSVYESSSLLAQIGFIELAGSENASNDQLIIKSNSLSPDEKKSIARSFNALSAVLTKEPLWKESNLTLSSKNFLDSNCNVVLVCTVTGGQNLYKHVLASLKYVNRIRQGFIQKIQALQQEIKERLQELRTDLKDTKIISSEWLLSMEKQLKNIEKLIKDNCNQLGSNEEYQEFQLECEILKKQLQILKTKPLNHDPMRRRSSSPISEDVPTDRDHYLRQKLSLIQVQNESHLKKIEQLNEQISQRDLDIKNYHTRVSELEKTVLEKDKLIQTLDYKLTESNAKLNEYSKRLKLTKEKSLKEFAHQNYGHSLLETQVLDLERKLIKEREENQHYLNKLKSSIQAKDQLIQDLQSTTSLNKDTSLQDLKQKVKSKSNTIKELEKQLLSINNVSNETRYKLDIEASSSKKYQDECLSLRKKLEDIGNKNSALDTKNLLLLQKTENLEKELNAARQEADNRKYKTHQLCANIKEMENTIYLSAEEAQRIKYELKQLTSENQMLRLDKENLYNENCDLREESNAIKQELKQLTSQFQETNQYLNEKENAIQKIQPNEPTSQILKEKKKKIKNLKEKIEVLQKQLKDCQAIAEEEIKKTMDERDQAFQELEEYKNSQIHDLSVVENQVLIIEEQLVKLKEQNKILLARESELTRENRNTENGKEKYKNMVLELKEEIKTLQTSLAEMDEFAKEYIENHRKEISEMKIDDEKAIALKSRIRAMHDVKNMIQAHRVQR